MSKDPKIFDEIHLQWFAGDEDDDINKDGDTGLGDGNGKSDEGNAEIMKALKAQAVELENIKKAQAGSDRKTKELLEENKELLGERDALKKAKMSSGEKMDALEKEMLGFKHDSNVAKQETLMLRLLSASKLENKTLLETEFLAAIGMTAEETKLNFDSKVKLFSEWGKAVAGIATDEVLGENGRKIIPGADGSKPQDFYTVEEMANLSPEEFDKNSDKIARSMAKVNS